MSDGRLKRNTSQPEFLVFPPKPTLPPVFSSHLGGASVLLAAQTKTLALDPSFCHRPIFDRSANPAGSIFITQQNSVQPPSFAVTTALQAPVSLYLHHGSPVIYGAFLLLFSSPYHLVSKQQPEVIYLKR